MKLQLFVHLTPTTVSELPVPASFQVFGKLLPKSANQIFCERNACATRNAASVPW